jgi:PTS system sucrose-specific IIC component
MDYGKVAKDILLCIGGKENVVSAAHCATRLRLVIADNAKCDKKKLEDVDGVKGVFEASGQLQVIIGTGTVNKVFDEFARQAGIDAGTTKDDVKKAAAAKQNIFLRAIKSLGDIFVPIIPAIVASGLMMGLLEGLCNLYPAMAKSSTYEIFHLFSNVAFVFLPILIAISAAKTFGGNQFLGAVIGMIMIHPDLMNAWSVASAKTVPTADVWFGLYHIKMVGYQGHVIPVVIAVWLMCMIEKKLHKIVPEMLDLFVTPLVTVMVTGYLTLTIIGPVFVVVENGVLYGAKWLIALPFGIGGAIAGALYAPTVVTGVHHMYNALEAGLLSSDGVNTWMPIATAANVGQGAAALALAIKVKNRKTKSVAFPASLSAFLGITEPAIFGVNLRFLKPFLAGCMGGLAGGLVAGIFHVGASAYGITGIFGFLITTKCAFGYLMVMLTSFVVAFTACTILFKESPESLAQAREIKAAEEKKEIAEKNDEAVSTEQVVYSPVNGEMIALDQVADETFAGKVLGDGAAVIPSEGVIYAPFDGTVENMFETKHAICLTSSGGIEILIHVGLNTVNLQGKGFEAYVQNQDFVHKGDKLLAFDLAWMKSQGYDMTTPVVVTNIDDYASMNTTVPGHVAAGDKLLTL